MRKPRSWTQWIRRFVQGLCLIAFLWVVYVTAGSEPGEEHPLLKLFFDADPLVLVATWLATRAVPAALLLALATIAVTLVFGRVFCGWVCPLGTVHNMAGWFRRRVPPQLESTSPWQRAKYFLLVALLVMAVFGAHWIGVFDPLSLLYRSVATAVMPGLRYALEESSTAVYQADPHIGPVHATMATEPVYNLFRDHVFRDQMRHAFDGGSVIMLVFLTLVLLNLYRKRFWCRYLCPLGGLLGLLSRRPSMRLHNEPSACNSCGKCNHACPAAAQPDKAGEWQPSECYGCWNCVASCNFNAVSFEFKAPLTNPSAGRLDLGRRATIAAGAAGAAALVTMRLSPQAQAITYNPKLIRPPGARSEREFLERCIQCGLCMRACPTGGLQPAAFEAGLEGVWTPVLKPRIGYCEYDCNLCGQVCPTEAIEPLTLEQKHEDLRIGLASFDVTRCIPYAYGRTCLVCEEHCPVSPKAIYFVETETPLRDGATQMLKLPRVDPDRCIGCGVCENKCPFEDRAAVRITSANESRHPGNQPILPGIGMPLGIPSQGESSSSPYG